MLVYLAMIDSEEGKSKFEIIYMTYKNLMLHKANEILGDTRDTEDVVHEAFLKIAKMIEKIDDPKCPKTKAVVVTIVERKAIDLYRKRKRRGIVSLDEDYINALSPDSVESVHTKTDLAAAMASLPAKYRELLMLRFDSGFSEAEVAEIMDMSQENVHKTIQRAKKKLAELLKMQEV